MTKVYRTETIPAHPDGHYAAYTKYYYGRGFRNYTTDASKIVVKGGHMYYIAENDEEAEPVCGSDEYLYCIIESEGKLWIDVYPRPT